MIAITDLALLAYACSGRTEGSPSHRIRILRKPIGPHIIIIRVVRVEDIVIVYGRLGRSIIFINCKFSQACACMLFMYLQIYMK